jgi:acyl-CoA thioesterase II
MTNALKKTLELFNLTRIDRDLYSWTGESVGFQRIFGGQIMAQCLIAGYQTVTKERMAHSFHSYFLRPGDFNQNIIFEVDRIRDGKSFTTRRVNAIQNGEAIFSCSISFQKREKGLSHQIKMSDIPGPEKLKSDIELRKNLKSKIPKKYLPMWLRDREIETRQVEEVDLLKPQKLPPYRNAWMKPNGKLPTNERIHQALLLYVSDMGLLGSAINPHEVNFMSKNFQSASLDHVMWFHGKVNFNNWILHQMHSPISANARGFSRGSIYTKAGKLIASTAQEGLMRVWE